MAAGLQDQGISSVWLTVDGTNNNCEADTPLSQQGKAKSLKHIPVVSYIWAVNAFGEKIYWNTNYLIGEDALFGIVR